MNKTELMACMEQADSNQAGVLLRDVLGGKVREALLDISLGDASAEKHLAA